MTTVIIILSIILGVCGAVLVVLLTLKTDFDFKSQVNSVNYLPVPKVDYKPCQWIPKAEATEKVVYCGDTEVEALTTIYLINDILGRYIDAVELSGDLPADMFDKLLEANSALGEAYQMVTKEVED